MIRKLICALAILVCLGQPEAAKADTQLSLSAEAALTAGQIEMARIFALAALEENPKDAKALAVLAAVGLATKEPKAARIVAAQSFRAASDDLGKFTAARLAARASVDAGENGVAKYWLRRAIQVAPTDTTRAMVIRDFSVLRGKARLRVDVDLSVKPSDNVNQGARDTMLIIDGQPTWFYFDGSTRALSGVEAAANVHLRYRLAGTAAEPTEIGLRLYHRGVILSDEAKALAPTASGSDFSNSAIDATLYRTMMLSPKQAMRMGVTLGRNYLAGEAYSDRARFDAALTTGHGERTRSRIGFAVERQWLEIARPHATVYALDLGLEQRLQSGDTVALRLDGGTTVSDDANQENRRLGASLRYALGKPVAGAKLSGSLTVIGRDYPVFFNGIFNDTGRQDVTVASSLEIALPKLGAFGFEPVLSIEASRTRSNISRYESETLGVGLRIQSSF
ncbi:hypothetical protein ACSBLW_18565 [Thioclava sp. FR2]|uniref:hypothetical protein n=1 Tax=Thioclava sp. FR2 TaxID=3445780 RepID=UPI003EB9C9D5